MTPAFHPDELGTGTPPAERSELRVIAQQLEAERPIPAPGFRGELRRSLIGSGRAVARPARLRLQIGFYGGSGALLLLAGAVAGPLSS